LVPGRFVFVRPASSKDLLAHPADAEFLNPKTSIQIAMRSELACKSARNTMMQRLFTDILEENMSPLSYQANEAGSYFGFDLDLRGFLLSFSGYTQQLPKLAQQVFQNLSRIQVLPEVFGRLKYELEKNQKNWSKSNAISKAIFLATRVTSSISFTPEEKLRELETITADEVLRYGKRILSEMFLEAYFHGSMGETVRYLPLAHLVLLTLSSRAPSTSFKNSST
jgi:insulysin